MTGSISIGFLSIPWAFYQSGILVGCLLLLTITIPLCISIPYNLEAMARADAVIRLRRKNDSFVGEHDPLLLTSESNEGVGANIVSLMSHGHLRVRRDKFELYELCDLFMGYTSKYLFLLCLALYTYGCLWAFGAVFSQALSISIPLATYLSSSPQHHPLPPEELSNISYWIYLVIFATLVIPLTCIELTEQVYTQLVLATCRLVVAILIVYTSLQKYLSHQDTYEMDNSITPTPLVNLRGITILLPIAVYALAFTQAMPTLSEPVQDKSQLAVIFQCTALVCVIGYAMIGISVALAFGSAVEESCNINWVSYESSTPPDELLHWLTMGVKFYIVMFPALDVLSAFPLMAITLGNNMFSCLYGHSHKKMVRTYGVIDSCLVFV